MTEHPELLAVIVALTQGLKALRVPARVLPLANVVLGIGLGLLAFDGPIATRILQGALLGAAAGGAYDVAHAVRKLPPSP